MSGSSTLISVITPVLNARDTIEDTIKSVSGQMYKNIEYIIVDNGSTDGTADIIYKYKKRFAKIIFEQERGIYPAMNTGIRSASGDIVGILNADDFYASDRVLEKVVSAFGDKNTDSAYGDLIYVSKKDPTRIVRYWKSEEAKIKNIEWGWMPPHPTFFVKREIYDKYGYFDSGFKIAADYELLLRFLYRYKISSVYIPEVLIKMRVGGISNRNLFNIVKKSFEDYKACRKYGIRYALGKVALKNIVKMPQFFIKGARKA